MKEGLDWVYSFPAICWYDLQCGLAEFPIVFIKGTVGSPIDKIEKTD